MPPPSSPRPDGQAPHSSDGLEASVIEDLRAINAAAELQHQARQALGVPTGEAGVTECKATKARDGSKFPDAIQDVVLDSSEGGPDTEKAPSLHGEDGRLRLPALSKKSSASGAAQQRKQKPGKPGDTQITPSRAGTSGSQLTHAIVIDVSGRSPAPGAADELTQKVPTFHYNSRETVRKNDLVIRVRDLTTIKDGANKHDSLDVYDGPFRVSRLPVLRSTSDVLRGSEMLLNGCQELAMKETLVKLHFPQDSLGDPWTQLGRLRPVYQIGKDVPKDADAEACYYWGKSKGRPKVIKNTIDVGESPEDAESMADVRGVCRIQKGVFVIVEYVAPESPEGDNIYEVSKLRNKSITRHPREEFPDEIMDDPTIVSYIEDGGTVAQSEVLVVKYLVHWAGWPSEDDTYERAQDNIPQSTLDEYKPLAPEAEIEEPPEQPQKRRKSELKAVKRSLHMQ